MCLYDFKAFCVLISDGVSLLGMMMIGGSEREIGFLNFLNVEREMGEGVWGFGYFWRCLLDSRITWNLKLHSCISRN